MPSTRGERSVRRYLQLEPPAEMRQAVITAPDRFEVVKAPVPQLQSDDEILVRTAACGICSGDLMPWYLEKKVGTVLGHEMVGWAVEVGWKVKNIRPGDLVFFHHHAPCLQCEHCERGAFVHCATWRSSKIDPGGMAEWIRVPGDIVKNDAFTVEGLTPEQAIFIEPLGCSLKAVGRVPDDVMERTGLIVGCGVMGMLNLLAAIANEADRLLAVEPDPERRKLATQFGADAALPPDEAAKEWKHLADFVIIGPGHPDIIRSALDYLRPGGSAVLFTPTAAGVTTPLDLGELYFREISLVPSYSCGPDDTQMAYNLLSAGEIDPQKLITHRFPLDQVQEAYNTAKQGGATLKVVVTLAEKIDA